MMSAASVNAKATRIVREIADFDIRVGRSALNVYSISPQKSTAPHARWT